MFGQLFQKFQIIRRNYLDRTPLKKWEFVRNFGIFVMRLVGVPILDRNFTIDWYSFVPLLVAVDSAISFFYTVWYFMDTPIKSMLVFSLSGTIIPVNTKFQFSFFFPSFKNI